MNQPTSAPSGDTGHLYWLGTDLEVWGDGVSVRAQPSRSSTKLGTIDAGKGSYRLVYCQTQWETVDAEGHSNDWWVLIRADVEHPAPGSVGPLGWMSAIFIKGGSDMSPIGGLPAI